MTPLGDEVTLEQIADSHAAGYWREFRLLAAEIIALRHSHALTSSYAQQNIESITDRLEALESAPARPTSAPGMVNIYERFVEVRAERDALQQQLDAARGALAAERRLSDYLADAIRVTREYVGEGTLPAREGWSWWGATEAYRANRALADTEPTTPTGGQS